MFGFIADGFSALRLSDVHQYDRDEHANGMFECKKTKPVIFHNAPKAIVLERMKTDRVIIPENQANDQHKVCEDHKYGTCSCIGANERPAARHKTIEDRNKKKYQYQPSADTVKMQDERMHVGVHNLGFGLIKCSDLQCTMYDLRCTIYDVRFWILDFEF
jgi:hypothetical protein